MKLNANKFALAAAISFAALWVPRTLLVALLPPARRCMCREPCCTAI